MFISSMRSFCIHMEEVLMISIGQMTLETAQFELLPPMGLLFLSSEIEANIGLSNGIKSLKPSDAYMNQ